MLISQMAHYLPPRRTLRVVVVDDHPLILEGIRQILESARYEVAAALSEPRKLLDFLQVERVDVVTLDIGMPGLNGIDLARQVKQKFPRLSIVFVTQQVDAAFVTAAIRAGASAFVSKQAAGTELIAALQAVSMGRKYVTAGLLDAFDSRNPFANADRKSDEVLTSRQREVLQLTAEGKTVKEIACTLNISAKTVEFHKQALMDRLQLRSTAELTRYAIAHGLVFM